MPVALIRKQCSQNRGRTPPPVKAQPPTPKGTASCPPHPPQPHSTAAGASRRPPAHTTAGQQAGGRPRHRSPHRGPSGHRRATSHHHHRRARCHRDQAGTTARRRGLHRDAPEISTPPGLQVTVTKRYANKCPRPAPDVGNTEPTDPSAAPSAAAAPREPSTSPSPSGPSLRDTTPEPDDPGMPSADRPAPPQPPAPLRHRLRGLTNRQRDRAEPDSEMRCDHYHHLIESRLVVQQCDLCGWWSQPPSKAWHCPSCHQFYRARRRRHPTECTREAVLRHITLAIRHTHPHKPSQRR